jgi:hypothetical protein
MSINEKEYARKLNSSVQRFNNIKPPVIYQPVDFLRKDNQSQLRKTESIVDIPLFANIRKTREELDDEQYENDKNDALNGGGCNPGETPTDDNDGGKKYKDASGKFDIFKIFEIVPIGLNILAKAPVLASGFVDLMMGMQKAIVNVSLTSFDLFFNTFSFSIQGFQFTFILLLCLIENISNLNICIIFYVIDLIVLICYLALLSLLSLIDAIFLKTLLGVSSVELLLGLYDPIVQLNDFLFDITGVHLIHYPTYITKMCYTCSSKLNTSKTIESGKSLLNVFTNKIPPRLTDTISKFSSAITKIGSIFNIK